jgi:predicted HicB family RNase H-like nuclease
MLRYKGYTAKIEFDAAENVLHGHVLGLRDFIVFDGKSVEEIRKSFRAAVDHYLQYCRSRNEEPEKPHNGKILLRVDPELHRDMIHQAAKKGESLNSWIESKLRMAIRPAQQTTSATGETTPSNATFPRLRKRLSINDSSSQVPSTKSRK